MAFPTWWEEVQSHWQALFALLPLPPMCSDIGVSELSSSGPRRACIIFPAYRRDPSPSVTLFSVWSSFLSYLINHLTFQFWKAIPLRSCFCFEVFWALCYFFLSSTPITPIYPIGFHYHRFNSNTYFIFLSIKVQLQPIHHVQLFGTSTWLCHWHFRGMFNFYTLFKHCYPVLIKHEAFNCSLLLVPIFSLSNKVAKILHSNQLIIAAFSSMQFSCPTVPLALSRTTKTK